MIHKENGGLSSARNAALDRMTGQYLCFVDSDDFVPQDALETLYAEVRALYPEYDVLIVPDVDVAD